MPELCVSGTTAIDHSRFVYIDPILGCKENNVFSLAFQSSSYELTQVCCHILQTRSCIIISRVLTSGGACLLLANQGEFSSTLDKLTQVCCQVLTMRDAYISLVICLTLSGAD